MIFEYDGDYQAFVDVLEEARRRSGMRLLAYAVLPNHWHLLASPRGDDDLADFMHWLTMSHTQRWQTYHGTRGSGPLYQGRFKSFPVEQDDHFYRVCRYVERNALRAGLTARAELWRWCSLWQHANDRWPVGLDDWPLARPTKWIEYVNAVETESELAALRASARRGTPFGAAAWQRETAKALGLESTLTPVGRPRSGE